MAIDLVTRREWGARAPRGAYSRLTSTRGSKIHYTGGRVDPAIVDDHARCTAMVRSIQNHHMDGNGWTDIGYSLVACPHRKVFAGRGPYSVPAANGPGLNSGHYAVLGLVGSSGLVEPNDAMLLGILDAIEYLRRNGGAGNEIKGHCDGYVTSCPGPALYAWVKRGVPRPKPAGPAQPAAKPEPVKSWTEVLVEELPTLRPGDEHKHVKTMRCLLFARGYEPRNLHSTRYGLSDEDLADLTTLVNAFKARHKLPQDGVFGVRAWEAALS